MEDIKYEKLLNDFGYVVRIPGHGGKPTVFIKRYDGCYINIEYSNFLIKYSLHLNIPGYRRMV
jgi:hypothetical protein